MYLQSIQTPKADSFVKDSIVYVADTDNHRVEVFNANSGKYIRTIGKGKGINDGQMVNLIFLLANL